MLIKIKNTLLRSKKSLIILIIVIALLGITAWIGPLTFSAEQLQAIQFSLTLLGIFFGGHYELQNLKYQLYEQAKEDRRKEIREQKLHNLSLIEGWLNEVGSKLEEIEVLRKLSPKDESDGKLMVNVEEKIKPLQVNLISLKMRGNIILAKAVDISNGESSELVKQVENLLSPLNDIQENLSNSVLPGIDDIYMFIPKAHQAIYKARTEN